MWGIIPAAGVGSRIQPLAFSKELLPVGSARDGNIERPRAVGEYLVDRMIAGGADKICFVISPGKADIIAYFGAGTGRAEFCYVVQPAAAGLCDAIFRAMPVIPESEAVLVGLPDTVWFPADGLATLGDADLSFLCFPVDQPELFDAVVSDDAGAVVEIQVKTKEAKSRWIWGAFKTNGKTLAELRRLWLARDKTDVYLGTLVNAWLAGEGRGRARALHAGRAYVDTGTVGGYREAVHLLGAVARLGGEP